MNSGFLRDPLSSPNLKFRWGGGLIGRAHIHYLGMGRVVASATPFQGQTGQDSEIQVARSAFNIAVLPEREVRTSDCCTSVVPTIK